MTKEMSNIEQENLQELVSRIARHIVEGSVAVQELKTTITRLKHERYDIEYVVYEHWLRAAKTIEAAGKSRASWERFINSLRIIYGDENKTLYGAESPKADESDLLAHASKELWAVNARNNEGDLIMDDSRFEEMSDTVVDDTGFQMMPNLFIDDSEFKEMPNLLLDDSGLKKMSNLLMDKSGFNKMPNLGRDDSEFKTMPDLPTDHNKFEDMGDHGDQSYKLEPMREMREMREMLYSSGTRVFDTEKLVQAASTIGEPSKKRKPRGKRKLEVSVQVDSLKKKRVVQFTDGKKLGGEQVVALKRDGRCFYCERKGHRAVECRENPDIQMKS